MKKLVVKKIGKIFYHDDNNKDNCYEVVEAGGGSFRVGDTITFKELEEIRKFAKAAVEIL